MQESAQDFTYLVILFYLLTPNTMLNVAEIKTEADRTEAIRLTNEQYNSSQLTETDRDRQLAELKALTFDAKPSNSDAKASWMTDEDEEASVNRPQGFLEKEDMVKIALSSVIVGMKFFKDGGNTPLVLGDDTLLNTLAIKEALEGKGSGYLELANGISVSLNSNSLPRDNFGKFVMPALGDSVRVARLVKGQCTITSQSAPVGRTGNSPYRIFEHEGVKYSGVVKDVTYRLLNVGTQIDHAKLNVLSQLKNVSAEEALKALGF